MQTYWGIDLGGTKIEGIILPSLDDNQPILRTRIDTGSNRGYDHILNQVTRLVNNMREASGLEPKLIGFGTPGVLDPRLQTMKNCNSTALNRRALKKDLSDKLGVPVTLANDANCFALAETHWGVIKTAAPEAKLVFGIIMGTGVGGGIVINNEVWCGYHGIGGEWGHNFLDETGGACYCGKNGCVETVISGPATELYYKKISGEEVRLREIYVRYKEGESLAIETIERLCYFFGRAVSVITNLLDPDAIIIGGGVGNIDELYTSGVASLRKHIFNNRLDTPILKPHLGDSA
ncbi:MAG: ROK family protein, partial [Proteobacteria bacterium]